MNYAAKLQNQTPYFHLFQAKPSYTHLDVCLIHLPPHERKKLSTQYVRCAFLGYATHQKGFLCYDPQLKYIRIPRNVGFLSSLEERKPVFFSFLFRFFPRGSLSIVPDFDDHPSPTSQRFNQNMVYVCQNKADDTVLPPHQTSTLAPFPKPDLSFHSPS